MSSSRTRRASEKSNASKMDDSTVSTGGKLAGLTEMEYFWSIELNADNKTYTWMGNDDIEADDEDFIDHTVFLKSATLGANAVSGEYNVVMLESNGFDGEPRKGAIVCLCRGQNNMSVLDLSLSDKVGPATFTLVEGSGPVYIAGNHLMEFPKDSDIFDNSQTESEEEETEDEDLKVDDEDEKTEEGEDEEEAGDDEEEESKKAQKDSKKAPKRKAGPIAGKPKQKAKMDVDVEDEEEESEEEEEEEEEDEESDSEVEINIKAKKSKNNKDSGKKETPKGKVTKKATVKKGKK